MLAYKIFLYFLESFFAFFFYLRITLTLLYNLDLLLQVDDYSKQNKHQVTGLGHLTVQ